MSERPSGVFNGRRLPDGGRPWFAAGDYWKDDNGLWWCRAPVGYVSELENHEVIEHEDGTITVSPSIVVTNGDGYELWHGYLECGVWREC